MARRALAGAAAVILIGAGPVLQLAHAQPAPVHSTFPAGDALARRDTLSGRDTLLARDTLPTRDTLPPSADSGGGPLPYAVAVDVAWLYNAPAALRARGPLAIAPGQVVNGDVAVLRGPVVIAGQVTGRVVAVNANVALRPGARIGGNLIVVGGLVTGQGAARIDGELRWFPQAMRLREEDSRIVAERDTTAAQKGWLARWRRARAKSPLRLTLRTGEGYNRVEGLPIIIGPSLDQPTPWGRVQVDALGVMRSAETFAWVPRNRGYTLQAAVRLGGARSLTLAGELGETVEPAERWTLRDTETSLAAFFLRRDFRDYFGRRGGGVSVTLDDGAGVSLALGYRAERWSALPARDPFSLFRDGEPWRPNPQLDAGRFGVATAAFTVDTRNDPEVVWSGWLVRATLERGASSSARLGPTSALARPAAAVPVRVDYTRGFVDARRYNRVSPVGQLNLRLVLGGQLGAGALPLQRRLGVSGPGALPGYDARVARGADDVLDCGGADAPAGLPTQCERIALAQIEYRGDLPLGGATRGVRDHPWDLLLNRRAAWVVFADAGRGWLVGAQRAGELQYRPWQLPPLGSFRMDVGAGLDIEWLGVFVAKSVSQPAEGANLIVRLGRRF